MFHKIYYDDEKMTLESIQNELQDKPSSIPQPLYDDKNLPKETIEAMFAQNFTKSSGNVDVDNQMVDYVQSTINNTIEEAPVVASNNNK